jgi:hypothetical protein
MPSNGAVSSLGLQRQGKQKEDKERHQPLPGAATPFCLSHGELGGAKMLHDSHFRSANQKFKDNEKPLDHSVMVRTHARQLAQPQGLTNVLKAD